MPSEGFIPVLKKMFLASNNWQSSPTQVARAWATKAVMHYRDPSRIAWAEDEVVPSGDFQHNIAELTPHSPFIQALVSSSHSTVIRSVRTLSKLSRGADEIRVGDCALVEQMGKPAYLANIVEMMQVIYESKASDHTDVQSYVRLWCSGGKRASIRTDGVVQAKPWDDGARMLVRLEQVQVSVVLFSHTDEAGYAIYQ